ncbi:MAG: helix-turn-helix domain-containing protein [Pseudomonadota bacterium]
MTTKRPPARRSACPLNASLEIFGDRWSLLIVRDLLFKGRKTFREFQDSEEGIATNILTDRLKRLESEGIVERRKDPQDARRSFYRLTEKGIDLAPVVIEMIVWGARYEKTAAPPDVIKAMTENRNAVIADLRRCWRSASQTDDAGPSLSQRSTRARR